MKELTGFMHGVNLGGWLSQCNYEKNHCDTFISENDIKTIKDWKLDHVRLPVDYNLFQTNDGSFIEDGFNYVQSCIDWCKKYQLNMILDLHKTSGYSFDADEGETGLFDNPVYQERFYALWEEFTKRYAKYEDMMCFELLNEVTDQSFSKPWNAIAKECVKRIRKLAPTIKILIGSYWNNSVSAVKDLDPPYDENIVYNFHCYDPLVFTHQGAGWLSKNMNTDFRMDFESTYAKYEELTVSKINDNQAKFTAYPQDATPDCNYFEVHWTETLRIAEERNVALYCGEYGVIDKANVSDILKWYGFVSKVLDKYHIGRAAWSFKGMNFGLSDSYLDNDRAELLKLL